MLKNNKKCSVCNQKGELIKLGSKLVCAKCKPIILQSIKENKDGKNSKDTFLNGLSYSLLINMIRFLFVFCFGSWNYNPLVVIIPFVGSGIIALYYTKQKMERTLKGLLSGEFAGFILLIFIVNFYL